jgi:flagellar hook-associated protein 3 FlgL
MRVNPNYTANMVSLLNQSQQDETNALTELSTGRRVNNPSDDPAAEAAMVAENSRSASVDQYTASSDSLTEVLNTADSTLSSVVTLLQRASTLGVEAANSATMNQTDLNSIANELSGIQSQMLSLANTSYAGQYLFGGTVTDTAPYVADATVAGQVDYAGNDQQNKVQIGTGLSVGANLPGSSIFSNSSGNVFDALQSMITACQSGSNSGITGAITKLSAASDTVNTARVFYGNTVNELTSNESYLSQEKVNIASYENTLVSCDTATATTAVTQAEYQRNATVAAAAKMNQVSLLDYLK